MYKSIRMKAINFVFDSFVILPNSREDFRKNKLVIIFSALCKSCCGTFIAFEHVYWTTLFFYSKPKYLRFYSSFYYWLSLTC